jgi:hypothetical protein
MSLMGAGMGATALWSAQRLLSRETSDRRSRTFHQASFQALIRSSIDKQLGTQLMSSRKLHATGEKLSSRAKFFFSRFGMCAGPAWEADFGKLPKFARD